MQTIYIQRVNELISVSHINHLDRIDPKKVQEVVELWRYFVALDWKTVVGILKWSYFQSHLPYCENIQVYPSHQWQWIGKQLLNAWHSLMQKDWYNHTMISTNPSNSIINRYKKLWYEEIWSIDLQGVLEWEDDVEIFLVKEL